MKEGVFIGELAKRAQVTIDTIRYYEKLGLLPKPARTVSSYRVYGSKTLDRLTFIKQAQALNLSLAEIAEILQLQRNDRSSCLRVQSLLKQHIEEIDRRMAELRDFRRTLASYLSECNTALAQGADTSCPVLEEIPHKPHTPPIKQLAPLKPKRKA